MKKKLPILSWLPRYSLDWAVSDMIAGVTVGLTVIPQVGVRLGVGVKSVTANSSVINRPGVAGAVL